MSLWQLRSLLRYGFNLRPSAIGYGSGIATALALVISVAQILSMAWELPYTMIAAKKEKNKKLPCRGAICITPCQAHSRDSLYANYYYCCCYYYYSSPTIQILYDLQESPRFSHHKVISIFFFFFCHACDMWKFPGQALNLCHSYNSSHSSDSAGSLTH